MSEMPYDGIVLTSYGGPEGQDEVIPFLRKVSRGKNIPDDRLEEVAQHYRFFDGVSPINAQNRELCAALETELQSRDIDLAIYFGNRNSEPFIEDTVLQAVNDGKRKLLGLVTSAYTSYSGVQQYLEDYERSLAQPGIPAGVEIHKIRELFDHPGFLKPFAEGVAEAVRELESEGFTLGSDLKVVFSTHSIPVQDALESGPEYGEGGAYVAQHLAALRTVMELALGDGGATAENWEFCYQSRSGPPHIPWLEPDISDHLAALAAEGLRAAVIVPLGFLSDHIEVLWDLDNEARDTAARLGIAMRRVSTPGVHPDFVAGLADLIEERLFPERSREHLTELGPWPDLPPVIS